LTTAPFIGYFRKQVRVCSPYGGEWIVLNLTPTRHAAIEARLRGDLIIWLTTVGPTGKPHTVPVWFDWDGRSVLIFSQPDTRKIRDLTLNPAVALALETRDEGEEVVFFEGTAELLSNPTSDLMTEAYIEKYTHLFPRIESSPEKMATEYTQPIRVGLAKVKAWGVTE